MKLRPARADDIPRLLAIEEESFRSDRLTARKIRRLLSRGNCSFVVATDAGRVAGYALVLFRRGAASARLYGIAVGARDRRHGLGARLLAAAEAAARRRGCDRLSLEVGRRNRIARKLYLRAGYVHVADLGPYYEDGAPAARFAKRL